MGEHGSLTAAKELVYVQRRNSQTTAQGRMS